MREGSKSHLVATGRLLEFDEALIGKMVALDDESCEALFVKSIESVCGGAVDWRANTGEVIEVVRPFLAQSEQNLLSMLNSGAQKMPLESVHDLNELLVGALHSIRALDTFGDFVIIVVVKNTLLRDFDEINKYWVM